MKRALDNETSPHRFRTRIRNTRARVGRFARQLVRPDRLTAILEQGLLTGIRVGALLVFARIMPTEEFGAFALFISISYMLALFQRSLVVLPFIAACQGGEATKPMRDWWWIAIVVAVATGLLLLGGWGVAAALGASGWLLLALFFSAFGAPVLMIYTFHRRMSYQIGDHRNVLAMVAVHVVFYAAGTVVALVWRDVHTLPFIVFALAPAAGAVVGAVRALRIVRSPPADLLRTFRSAMDFTKWALLSALTGAVYTNGMNIIAAGMLGAVGSATFTASRTIVAPIVSLLAAIDMIDKPRAGRALAARGLPGLRHSVRTTLATLLLLGVPFLLLVAAFSGPILDLVYGPKYAGLETELRLWAAIMFLNLLASPMMTHLTTLRDTRSVFFCSLSGAILALAIAVPLMDRFGLAAALAGMICGRLVNVVLLYFATNRISSMVPGPALAGVEAATKAG